MKNKPTVSLCIPTNGMPEWVIPALESIYSQNEDEAEFEVLVCDNGKSNELEKAVEPYNVHSNFIYKKSDAVLFDNVIEAYKSASGEFIKFINNKMKLLPGAVRHFIEFAENNMADKPIIYFANGSLKNKGGKKIWSNDNFNNFVKDLSIQNSNGDGIAIWKEDLDRLLEDKASFNKLFPDMTILYSERSRSKYIIDNTEWNVKKETSHAKKGAYDLYYAFAVEYLSILIDLLQSNDITMDCFLLLKSDMKKFIYDCYFKFNVMKKPCSYDISNFNESMKIYYGKQNKYCELLKLIIRKTINKIWRDKSGKR